MRREGFGGHLVALAAIPLLLSACTGSTRLNTNRAFLTAQIAFKSVQQTAIAVCSAPAKPAACNDAIDLLHQGALAERAGFTAQQAGNSADTAKALQTLTALPAQLVALGILKAN